MRQVTRRVFDQKGRIRIEEIPVPHCGPDQVLVASHYPTNLPIPGYRISRKGML